MSASPVRCVVFDLDDTLFLERDYVRSGFDAISVWAREQFRIEDFGDRAWARFERGERGNIFDAVLREAGHDVDPIVMKQLVGVYRTHDPAIALTTDSAEVIELLRVRRTTMAVVTDGPLASQRAKVRALDVDAWSAVSIFTEELGEGFTKPHPRAFEQVELFTGDVGAACAYVADNPQKDFGAPRALGWCTIRVRRSGSLHEAVATNADIDVETVDLYGALAALDLATR